MFTCNHKKLKKKVTVLLSATVIFSLLSGCAHDSAPGPESSAVQQNETAAAPENATLPEAEEKDYTTGTPWLCSVIEGTVTKDTPTDPKDDFYLYVNKDKLLSFELTDQRPEMGPYVDVQYKVDGDIRPMNTEDDPEGQDARLV